MTVIRPKVMLTEEGVKSQLGWMRLVTASERHTCRSIFIFCLKVHHQRQAAKVSIKKTQQQYHVKTEMNRSFSKDNQPNRRSSVIDLCVTQPFVTANLCLILYLYHFVGLLPIGWA